MAGIWRTVKGRKIFINDGQSLSDAMNASGKFPNKYTDINVKDDKPEDSLVYDNIKNESDEAFKNMSLEQKKAVKDYFEDDYASINQNLNKGKSSHKAELIESSMNKYNLKNDVMTYRTTKGRYYENAKEGDVIKPKIFSSTSLSKEYAKDLAFNKNTDVILDIKVGKGSKCLYIGHNNGRPEKGGNEFELLLSSKTSFKVGKTYTDDNQIKHIEMKVVN